MKQTITNQSEQAWRAETLRITLFLDGRNIDVTDWWEIVVGEPPENRNSKPKLRTLVDEGHYGSGKLVLNIEPNRADWIYFPSFDFDINNINLDNLLLFEQIIHDFEELFQRIIKKELEVTRIAFGCNLLIPVENKSAGYKKISEYLSEVNVDPDNSSDLLYQINRRRKSKSIDQLLINRLSKWLVAITNLSRIEITPGVEEKLITFEESYFVRLELDINSVPDNNIVLTKNQLALLFTELIELGNEIARKGTIP